MFYWDKSDVSVWFGFNIFLIFAVNDGVICWSGWGVNYFDVDFKP